MIVDPDPLRPPPLEVATVFFTSLIKIVSLGVFLAGVFTQSHTLVLVGGVAVVLLDVAAIFARVLNPAFPVLLAIILAVVLDPWYYGVFWASAAFHILGLPTYIARVLTPRRTATQMLIERDPEALLKRMIDNHRL